MNRFPFEIAAQPDDSSCGPTCLHGVYRYYGDSIRLKEVITETGQLALGGTLAPYLGSHALKRGYTARIYTYDLNLFDPTWFMGDCRQIVDKLQQQMQVKPSSKLQIASHAFIDFLELGGEVRMEVLNADLILRYLEQEIPILTGLSSTFLYWDSRERVLDRPMNGQSTIADDISGFPSGHFVVLCGYDKAHQKVTVADPYEPNPFESGHLYAVDVDQVFSAIMLGIVTYDANLLMIFPPPSSGETSHAYPDCQ